jgi:hypothetical protein
VVALQPHLFEYIELLGVIIWRTGTVEQSY